MTRFSSDVGGEFTQGGLQFIVDTNESGAIKKSGISSKEVNLKDGPAKRCRLWKQEYTGFILLGFLWCPEIMCSELWVLFHIWLILVDEPDVIAPCRECNLAAVFIKLLQSSWPWPFRMNIWEGYKCLDALFTAAGGSRVWQIPSAALRRAQRLSSGNSGSNLLRFYTDDAPGLKITPMVVLVMGLCFIGFVVALHVFGEIYRHRIWWSGLIKDLFNVFSNTVTYLSVLDLFLREHLEVLTKLGDYGGSSGSRHSGTQLLKTFSPHWTTCLGSVA